MSTWKELTRQEALIAWAQGKRVEATGGIGDFTFFEPVDSPGINDGLWTSVVFKDECGRKFRIAAEPPTKKCRPWDLSEIPVGARFRRGQPDDNHCWIITGWNPAVLFISNPSMPSLPLDGLHETQFEHSIDGGKTWLRCGVEVEA